MRPIPKKLLIHSVSLARAESEDRWGNSVGGIDLKLTKIRVEPSSKVIRDKNNAEVQLAAVLFFDCKNSGPLDYAPKVDDVIDFNGQKHRVQIIEPLYDGEKLHHYELGLLKSV